MEENLQCSNSINAAGQPTGSEDTISEQDAAEETSKLPTPGSDETSNLGTTVTPVTTSKQAPAMPTPSELEQLKKTDPVSFLKTMMSIDSASFLGTPSTVLAGAGEKDDISKLLHQIRERFFETNLVEALSSDSTKYYGLNNLLKKVDLLLVLVEVSEVIVLLSSLIEQLQSNLLRKRDIDGQLTAKMTSHSSSWEAANNATKKADTLKLECSKNQREYEECEANIKAWKQEIEKLKGKIKDAQSRQVKIQKTNQDELTEVAQSGIRHFETAQKLVPEIEELKRQQALIERHMSLWESQYSKIKDNLPRDFN
ncbi:uncharacterized protein LOC131611475 [Vicia villosa]|uniref:uncharacterized protein LOC131611475 n=1 Tax=Vicia villosa TaxID=3911 RepID=UPI00273BEABE|nr:uncharacterized protein LOC131611475 [Vicia villosa]